MDLPSSRLREAKNMESTATKVTEREKAKKQVPLRISAALWNDLQQWAEDDFRSINGQIEWLLTECVKQHKKNGGNVPKDL